MHGSAGDCLTTAVPASQRRHLIIEGKSTPIQLWVLDWNSAALITEVFRILAQEVLGVESVVGATAKSSSSRSMPRAMTGCAFPEDDVNPCVVNVKFSNYHIGFEAWESVFLDTHAQLLTAFPSMAADLLGEVGYAGHEGMFLANRVQTQALDGVGLALDYYRSYNTSWHSPWTYFSSVTDISNSDLLPCTNVTTFNDAAIMDNYLHWTQDFAGLHNGIAKCWQGNWFFSPACRASPSTCIPVLLDSVWYFTKLPQMMQQAFWNSMPLALGATQTRTAWTSFPVTHRVLFYWWIPDGIFIEERPHIISFMHHEPSAYAKGLYSSAFGSDKLWKIACNGLKDAAREVYEVGKNLQLSMTTMQSMLLKLSSGVSIHETACDWIKQNNETWNAWIPDPRVCGDGRGITSDNGEFLTTLDTATKCELCSPGRYSTAFQTTSFATRVCETCSIGKFSIAYASTECASCPQGMFTALVKQTQCERCSEGSYQSSLGSTACIACSASFITKFLGAYESTDCECPSDYSYHVATGRCERCPQEGILCPGGFKMNANGTDTSPLLQPGFMALPEDPLSVYTCVNPKKTCVCYRSPFPSVADAASFCKGENKSASGMCGPGVKLSGQCGACMDGYWVKKGQGCQECPSSGFFYGLLSITITTIVQCCLLLYLYIRFNIPQTSGHVVLGCLISFSQLLASTSRIPLLWPKLLSWMPQLDYLSTPTGMFAVFSFHPECIVGNSFIARLLYNAASPLVFLCFFLPLAVLFRLFGRSLRRHRVLNIIGLLFGNFFVGISGMTLTMFTYDKMPNGLYMTKEFPELELGSSDWLSAMPISILACLMYCVSFLVYCAHAALTAPQQAASNPIFVKQHMFMLGIYRPECWWWLLVMLIYGLSVNAIQTLSSSVHFKLYGCIFAGMAFVAIQIYVLPFKFMICNCVDITLKSGVFIIWMLCLPLIEMHEGLDVPSLHNACGYLIFSCLVFVVTVAILAFLRWLIGLLRPPGVERGNSLRRAMQSRHVFAAVDLLKEKELLSRLSRLGDEDLNKLSRCTSMIASALLGLQPSSSLLRQRVMPGVTFRVWDPKLTELRILQATLSGEHEKSLLKNLAIRRQLVTLSRLMEECVFKKYAAGTPFFETDEFKGSSDAGSLQYLTSRAEHVATRFFNLVLTYNSTEHNNKASLLGLHNKDLTMMEFCSAVKGLLGAKVESLDLPKLFDLIDLNKNGVVSMDDFVTCIMSESQERTDIASRSSRNSQKSDDALSNHTDSSHELDVVVKKTVKSRLQKLRTYSLGIQGLFNSTNSGNSVELHRMMQDASQMSVDNTDLESNGKSSSPVSSVRGRDSPPPPVGSFLCSGHSPPPPPGSLHQEATTVEATIDEDSIQPLAETGDAYTLYESQDSKELLVHKTSLPPGRNGEDETDKYEWC